MQPVKTITLLALAFLFCFAPAHSRDKAENLPAQSLLFIENKGQVTDQNGNLRPDIDVKLQTPGVTVFIGSGQVHYQWTKITELPQSETPETTTDITPGFKRKQPKPTETSIYRMDMILEGANINAPLQWKDADNYYETYYTSQTGQKGAIAHTYRKLIYTDIYPGIDWVLYVQHNAVKYDFIVHAGADPKQIKMRYEGATSLELNNGALTATTPYGSITEDAPYSYNAENNEQVASSFILQGNTVSFNAKPSKSTIIIDPQLHWATYYGGFGVETALTSTDLAGNVVLTGTTTSTTNIATSGSAQVSINGGSDCYLAKFTSDGTLLWASYCGGNGAESCYSSTIDLFGNIYFIGTTISTSGLATAGTHRDTSNQAISPQDAFIIKVNPNGQKLWGTYYGGEGNVNRINAITTDKNGDVYIGGSTSSLTGIATQGPIPTTGGGGFIAKFNQTGQRLWGTYHTVDKTLHAYDVACDKNGDLIVVGTIWPVQNDPNFATTGAHQTTWGGNRDGYVAKYSPSGNIIWNTYYGGSNSDELFTVTTDEDANIYCAGTTQSSNNVATTGTNKGRDGVIVKFDTYGTRIWGRYFGGSASEMIQNIWFHPGNQKLYFSGWTSSSNMTTQNAIQYTYGGAEDIFLAEMSTSDTVLWSTYYGGNKREESYQRGALAIGPDNHLYLAFITGSGNLATTNAFRDTMNGPNDAMLVSIALEDTLVYVPVPYIDTNICVGDTVKIPYKTSFTFKAGNTFTAQLSDSSGDFTNAVNIGSISKVSSDTITCIIPTTTITGKNYKIRVVGNNPVRTSVITPFRFNIYEYPSKPTATATQILCTDDTLFLSSDNTGANVKYSWAGPNSFIGSRKDTIITNITTSASGNYIITATRGVCSIKDTTDYVTVKQRPAKPTISSNTPLCAADTLRLFGSSTSNGVNYSWTGPNSFAGSAGDTAFKAPSTNATGQYKLTVEKDGCSSFDTMTLIVKPLPQAVTVSNNGPVCDGNTLLLNCGTSTNGSTYSWSGVGSFTANTQNTSISNPAPSTSGWYYATVTLNGCTYKDSTNATVNPIPVISSMTASNPLCLGQNLQLNTNNISSATYSWTGPNGFTANIRNPQRNNMQYSDTGWYKLTATANNCISKPDSVRITLNPLPFVTIFGNKDTICPGGQVTFTALPNLSGAAPTFTWKVNTQTVASGNIYSTTSLNNGDIISCEMTEYTKCNGPYTDPSNDVTITVMPWLTPSVSISANPTGPLKPAEFITFTANAQNAGNNPGFQWKRNGADLVGAKGAIWSANTLNDNDSISVVLTSNYICPQPATVHSNGIKVRILTGVDSKGNITKLTLYPNPNNGKFILDGKLPDGLWQLTVVNSIGQVVYKTEVQAGNGTIHTEISLPQVAAGTYLLRLQNETGLYTARFGVE